MSMTVTHNSDGTITVNCGTDTITIANGSSVASGGFASPVNYPPVVTGGGGITASFMADSQEVLLKQKHVSSSQEVVDALRAEIGTNLLGKADLITVLRIHYSGQEPIDVTNLNRAAPNINDNKNFIYQIFRKENRG